MRKNLYFFLIFSTFTWPLLAQKKVQVELHLKDQSKFVGEADFSDINFATKYGTLKIPVADISTIFLSSGRNDELKVRVVQLIADLGSDSKSVSDKAEEAILELGIDAVGYIQKYLDDQALKETDLYGTTDRLTQIVQHIMSAAGDMEYRETDRIVLNDDSQMDGTFNQNEITLRTNFGVLKIARKYIHSITIQSIEGQEMIKSFTVMANQHITSNPDGKGYLNTKIKIKKGDRLNIRANGSVWLAYWAKSFTPPGSATDGYGSDGMPYGALIGRIGENGLPFLIGAKYNNIAQDNGILYLSITDYAFYATNTGEYRVNVRVNK